MRRSRRWVLAGCAGGVLLTAAFVCLIRGELRRAREAAPPIEAFARTADGEPICPYCGRTDQVREYI
ncbi:MAG TPA: hypothetical protein VH092_08980, partial [Urbifossiella sp.]|nr:hypothetical protein [Urbifossiella sp.]